MRLSVFQMSSLSLIHTNCLSVVNNVLKLHIMLCKDFSHVNKITIACFLKVINSASPKHKINHLLTENKEGI